MRLPAARRLRTLACLLPALALTACSAEKPTPAPTPSPTATQTETAPSGLPVEQIHIRSGDQSHYFRVEIAGTQAEQTKGLMFRTELADDQGMLFPFAEQRVASFWMKNTYIPLDIIFIRADGSIESIAANTEPMSLTPVTSGEPVAGVLEIAGGRAAALGIAPGDRLIRPAP